MSVAQAPAPVTRRTPALPAVDRSQLPEDARALLAGGLAVLLMLIWTVDDGGTDPPNWYWGALVALAGVAALLALSRGAVAALPRALKLALTCFTLYVGWSYLSMAWAAYPGLALQGSNRALLYLLIFTLMAIVPWRRTTALLALGAYGAGIGVIAVAFLIRFALGDHVDTLFLDGRLVSPTGYFNSNAALFTIGALVAIGLGARRGIPAPLRGLFAAFAAADFMLALTPQSRGWLFTLPVVGLYAVIVAGGRLRLIAVAIPAAAGTLLVIHPLLALFDVTASAALTPAAEHAGKVSLVSCAGVFALTTVICAIESIRGRGPLGSASRRGLGALGGALAGVSMLGGLWVVSDHHPGSFISRQWHGFTSEPSYSALSSHFTEVGSGRYDIWRSAIDAFLAHPVGGLGQDNFGDWYLTHRHTTEEPLWTHSLWLRLLTHTGAVGFLLFVSFLIAAFVAAIGARRRGGEADRMLVGAALLPIGVWLIHGSIDWFWEFPALSAPALGFLAMAGGLRGSTATAAAPAEGIGERAAGSDPASRARRSRLRMPAPVSVAAGILTVAGLTAVLGLPYLAVRELNLGVAASHENVNASLADFHRAHELNPLMSDPGVLAGSVALVNGRDSAAAGWYRQAVTKEPGAWIAWLGRGLADSAQGEVDQARQSFMTAMHLDHEQLAVRNAARLVGTQHPLTAARAFQEIDYLP